jgi:hypothetical protein
MAEKKAKFIEPMVLRRTEKLPEGPACFEPAGRGPTPIRVSKCPDVMLSRKHIRRRDAFATAPAFNCSKTVSELDLLKLLELLFERKQIPQNVINIRISRKPMEPLDAAKLRWAHRSRVNIPGPRGDWLAHTSCTQSQPTSLQVQENLRSTKLLALIDANQWRGAKWSPALRSFKRSIAAYVPRSCR